MGYRNKHGNFKKQHGGGVGVTKSAALAAGGSPDYKLKQKNTMYQLIQLQQQHGLVVQLIQVEVYGSAGGTATAGLIFGGYNGSINYVNNSEEWDGTSWTEGNDLATKR